MDTIFSSSLLDRDKKKMKKKKKQRSKEGNLVIRKDYRAKFEQSHKEQIHDTKTGKIYNAGVALVTSKKRAGAKLTTAARNPKGAPNEL